MTERERETASERGNTSRGSGRGTSRLIAEENQKRGGGVGEKSVLVTENKICRTCISLKYYQQLD